MTTADMPKLSDFGLSMIAEQGDQSGVVRGTPQYMSPEQTRGVRLDYRTDLYSLGVMLYESRHGHAPFTGTSISIMSQHFSAEPEPPRTRNPLVSEELEALIRSLLAKKPERRPGSGAMVAGALRRGDRPDSGTGTRGHTNRIGNGRNPASQHRSKYRSPRSISQSTDPSANGPDDGTEPGRHRCDRRRQKPRRRIGPHRHSHTGAFGARTLGIPRRRHRRQHGRRHGVDSLAPGPADARGGPGRADPAVRRGALPPRPLSGLPPERLAAAGTASAAAHGAPQRRPRPVAPGPDLRHARRRRPKRPIRDAAALLDQRIEVRAILSPVVVAKYLACRESPARRKLFRRRARPSARPAPTPRNSMIDAKGVLNPGLMPQRLEDLNHLAPPRTRSTTSWSSGGTASPRSGATSRRSGPRCSATPPPRPIATRPARRYGPRSSIP